MRYLFAALVLMAGCHVPIKVRSEQTCTGVAISTQSLLTVIHPPHVGMKVRIRQWNGWVQGTVVKVGPRGAVRIEGPDLDLRPGDSGGPVVALIEGEIVRK